MNNNHTCIVCLGSNIDGEIHLRNAYKLLVQSFPDIKMGKILRTKAEGNISQPDYFNQAATFTTNFSLGEVESILKEIEKENGRKFDDKFKGTVPLDIDLLQYNQQVIRSKDMFKKYVRQALQELKP